MECTQWGCQEGKIGIPLTTACCACTKPGYGFSTSWVVGMHTVGLPRGEDWDPFNHHMLCLYQARVWIFNVMGREMFVQWVEVMVDSSCCLYLANFLPSLFKVSFHIFRSDVYKQDLYFTFCICRQVTE